MTMAHEIVDQMIGLSEAKINVVHGLAYDLYSHGRMSYVDAYQMAINFVKFASEIKKLLGTDLSDR